MQPARVSHRLVTKPSRARPDHADAGADRSGGFVSRCAATTPSAPDAEQPLQHAISTAEETGRPNHLLAAERDRAPDACSSSSKTWPHDRCARRRRRRGRSWPSGRAEHAALDGRRRARPSRSTVRDRHHLVEPVRHVDDRGVHAHQHGEQPLDLAGLERGAVWARPGSEPATTAQRLARWRLALGKAQPRSKCVGWAKSGCASSARWASARMRADRAWERQAGAAPAGRRARGSRQSTAPAPRNSCGMVATPSTSLGLAKWRSLAVDREPRRRHAAEDAHQRRLAGAVLSRAWTSAPASRRNRHGRAPGCARNHFNAPGADCEGAAGI